MNTAAAARLRDLVAARTTGALGTLHDGAPFVSMVPFALLPGGTFVLHVSGLAAHTGDMRKDPRVSLLVTAPEGEAPPQALPRITVSGTAEELEPESREHEEAAAAYLARFPEAEQTFALADFALFAVRPSAVRFVGGFAQALSLAPDAFARALAG